MLLHLSHNSPAVAIAACSVMPSPPFQCMHALCSQVKNRADIARRPTIRRAWLQGHAGILL